MKQGSNQRRSRGRTGGGGNNSGGNTGGNTGGNAGGGRRGGRNQNFDSNGPDVKIRGSAQQVLDKYLQLARDAQSSGDRVKAEGYLQFAEHYYRLLNIEQEGNDRQQRTVPNDQGEARSESGGSVQGQPDQAKPEQGRPDQGERNSAARNQNRAQRSRSNGDADGNVRAPHAQGENDQGASSQDENNQGENVQAEKPARPRRRVVAVKNEATLAAEAAAANEARAAGKAKSGNGSAKVDASEGEAEVISTAPAVRPITDTDDDTPEAANG